MHELSCVLRLVQGALKALSEAEENPMKEGQVEALVAEVGEMTGYLPTYMRKYYPEAVEGTPLAGSELIVETIPVEVACLTCGQVYAPKETPDMACPACGEIGAKILHGRELLLKELRLRTSAR